MTRHLPDSDVVSIYDAAMRYKQEQTPLAVIAGKEYGSGSSRDWAAKVRVCLVFVLSLPNRLNEFTVRI